MKRGGGKAMMSFQLLLVLMTFQSTFLRVCYGDSAEDHVLQIRKANDCIILDFNETFIKNICEYLQIFVQDSGDLVYASRYSSGENEALNNSARCGNQTVFVRTNQEEDRQRWIIPVCGLSSKYCNHQCQLQPVCVRKNEGEDHRQWEINATKYMCSAPENFIRSSAATPDQPGCDDGQEPLTCDCIVYKVLLGIMTSAFAALVLWIVLFPRQLVKLSERICRRKFGRCVRPSANDIVE